MLRLFLLLYVPSLLLGQQWNAQNYPNPTAGQFRECKMKTHARICDPDGVLDEGSRSRLDYELQQLERRTEQQYARTFCEKKGITAAMAVAKRVQGGSTQAVEDMANNMLKTWILDQQCQKSIVIVVATDDAKFWVARDDKVPVYANEFTGLFMKQKETFKRKQYVEALQGLIQGTWELALSKQGTPRQQPAPGPRPTAPQPGYGEGGRSTGPGMKMPSIPGWVWIVLIFVVIPTLLCCCCIYCCCCRGKGGGGGGGRQPLPQDIPAGGGGSGGGGGGGRGPFGNFLSTLSGAGVGSMIGNFLSNRNRGGAGAGSMGMGGMGGGGYSGGGEYQGGGAHPAPPQPTYDDNDGQGGGGLYPSVAVKDRGGGGSWE